MSGTEYVAYRARVMKAVAGYGGNRAALVQRLAAVADETTATHRTFVGLIAALESLPDEGAAVVLRRLVLHGPPSLSDSDRCSAARAYCSRPRAPEQSRELLGSPVQSVRDEALRCIVRWLREVPSEQRSLPKEIRDAVVDAALRGELRSNGEEVANVLSWDCDPATAAMRTDVIATLMEQVAGEVPWADGPWAAEAYIDALARLRDCAPRLGSLHESARGRMRVLLALALGQRGSTEVKPEVLEALSSNEERIVLKAVAVLGIIGDRPDVEALRRLRSNVSTPSQRRGGDVVGEAVDAAIAAIERRTSR